MCEKVSDRKRVLTEMNVLFPRGKSMPDDNDGR